MTRIFTKKIPVPVLVIRWLPLLIRAIPAGITSVANRHVNATSKICPNYPDASRLTGNPAPVVQRLPQ
jgi:hypothetical protein